MSSPDDLETRVANLENQVAQLRRHANLAISDPGAARLLASGADQDVSTLRAELRAHTQVLGALRETQLETREIQLEQGRAITGLRHDLAVQGTTITGLAQRVTGLEDKVAGLDQRVTGLDERMTEGFETLNTGMTEIKALLTGKSGPEAN